VKFSAAPHSPQSRGTGVAHGDLYAHNILCCDNGIALLGDFGAATIYHDDAECVEANAAHQDPSSSIDLDVRRQLQQVEVRAFGVLILELLAIVEHPSAGSILQTLELIARACMAEQLEKRPLFADIVVELQKLMCS
jgi:serine/threonine protein kinase